MANHRYCVHCIIVVWYVKYLSLTLTQDLTFSVQPESWRTSHLCSLIKLEQDIGVTGKLQPCYRWSLRLRRTANHYKQSSNTNYKHLYGEC